MKFHINSIVASLKAAEQTNQIILVVGNGGSNATISLHQKEKEQWIQLLTTEGCVGLNGITSDKVEGDAKTPAGVFHFGLTFGISPNPGTNSTYCQITDTHYWVDDPESEHYNQLVDTKVTKKNWKSAEHLMNETISYKYAVEICFNPDNIPGKGSAVFLHCIHGNSTAGCVSVSENVMKHVLRAIDGDTLIVIAESREALMKM